MRFALILLLLYSIPSCKVTKDLIQCRTKAMVVDLSDLDGCGFVLQLEDESRLLATNINDYDLTAGQSVFIDYKSSDAMGICMAASSTVELTCVLPRPKLVCPALTSIPENSWIQRRINQMNPKIVSQYKLKSAYIYRFETGEEYRWYDCYGNLICTGKDATDCTFALEQLSNKTDLWIAHR